MAKGTDDPAKGEWFCPGGRLYKGEELEAAARRVAREELGIEVSVKERLGVYAHFWETSTVAGEVSRHTVNVVFRVTLADPGFEIELRVTLADPGFEIELDEQHDVYRFLSEMESGLHEYVRRYVEHNGLLNARSR